MEFATQNLKTTMKDYQIKSLKNKETNALEVLMMGHLNVSNIAGIQREFNTAIKNSKKIELKILNVDDADLSIVQLIEVFKRKCKKSEIDLSINFNLNTDTSELFKRAGLTNLNN